MTASLICEVSTTRRVSYRPDRQIDPKFHRQDAVVEK
jgi:hypothetical protein